MTFNWYPNLTPLHCKLLACFGGARVYQYAGGSIKIRGGTFDERADAHAWRKQHLAQNTTSSLTSFPHVQIRVISCSRHAGIREGGSIRG